LLAVKNNDFQHTQLFSKGSLVFPAFLQFYKTNKQTLQTFITDRYKQTFITETYKQTFITFIQLILSYQFILVPK